MGDPTLADEAYVDETFTEVRRTIRAERRRTASERQAFEAFADRINALDFPGPQVATAAGGGHQSDPQGQQGYAATVSASPPVASAGHTAPTAAVRRAYEETVMSVSFYQAEYGDGYVESLQAEFGPALATALTDPACFGPGTKQALTAAIRRATEERTFLMETCSCERDAVDAAAGALLPVATEVDELASAGAKDEPFGTLEARWTRLETLRERCHDAAADRQHAINDHRDRHDLPVDEPDVCAYLYAELDATYPVLALCAALVERVRTVQDRYSRALARY